MKHFRELTLFVGTLILAGATHAENGCPPGQVPQQGNGWRACVPLNNGAPESGAADNFVGPRWTARWVSLAVDNLKPILGKSAESTTQNQAERSALADCTSQGGTTCNVLITAKNSCVAMVVGDTRITTSSRSTKLQAETAAMESCKNRPDTNCSVYYSACVEPVPE
ncbi:DUF4189 domain-containing protein [Luteibacter sp. NPDC031894]|uniref:DUF4189 domain-containing protein n=1 Tax=Luteibacter sp. NPDC031894 TaxID=3390572 RepID=UPI003CFF5C5A